MGKKYHPHGTIARRQQHYADGEKPCQECRDFHVIYERRRKAKLRAQGKRVLQRLVPAWPTLRRIEALQCMGYTQKQILEAAGVERASHKMFAGDLRDSVNIQPDMAKAINKAYRKLATRPAPEDRHSRMVATISRKKGWASPAAWDDIDDPNEEPKGLLV